MKLDILDFEARGNWVNLKISGRLRERGRSGRESRGDAHRGARLRAERHEVRFTGSGLSNGYTIAAHSARRLNLSVPSGSVFFCLTF